MMLTDFMRGIDISNYQEGLNLSTIKNEIDFVIVKATEGTSFVDWCCDKWVQWLIKHKMPFGFYHFARDNSPINEANHFIENAKGYFGLGIPVLDIEVTIYNWSDYANKFCKRVHDATGVWPMVYTSAGMLPNLDGFKYVNECGLWVAGYPYQAKNWNTEPCPYNVNPWSFPAIWQFTDVLQLDGSSIEFDGDIAYMDVEAWNKYVLSSKPNDNKKEPAKDISKVAFDVIKGKYGNGAKRRNSLSKAGYDYAQVQKYVDNLYKKAHEVLKGRYGNGQERVKKLGKNYDAVQYIINNMLS